MPLPYTTTWRRRGVASVRRVLPDGGTASSSRCPSSASASPTPVPLVRRAHASIGCESPDTRMGRETEAAMLVLIGVLLVVVGFALRLNPLVVVTVAGIVTGLLGGLSPMEILNAFGTGFAGSRSVTLFIIVLPVIGLIERFGLQEQARRLIARLGVLTTGRLLTLYQLIRQVTAALGLNSIGGPAQAVRPLIYPMAEGAAARRYGRCRRRWPRRSRGTRRAPTPWASSSARTSSSRSARSCSSPASSIPRTG
ncbi:hypothetical protein Asera_13070 [Actinocatenispora sera]|uniref:DUF969 domain-containing protein n=1 Tax=Actinocatenispora sera TaxID=390989 RepID=A0A810KXT7_9ACTN|nr:hypothetical protein Asera_13070 [Actinocatenispora sera]